MAKFVYVDGDDWNAIYVDGYLSYEGHDTLTYSHLVILRDNGVDLEDREVNHDWLLNDAGRYPARLEEVKFNE